MARGFRRGRAAGAGVRIHAPRSLQGGRRPGSFCESLPSVPDSRTTGVHRMCQTIEMTYRGVSRGARPRRGKGY